MPQDRSTLPQMALYIENCLIPDPISSAPDLCSICYEKFDQDHGPVRLQGCGHIFGRKCILDWFNANRSNSNTCPLDRTVLFTSLSQQPRPDNTTEPQLQRRRRGAQSYTTLIQGGEIIGIGGALTREGCRRCIIDLWFHSLDLSRQIQQEELDSLSVDLVRLRRTIQDAIPRGIEVPERAWTSLISIARSMMVLHRDNSPGVGPLLTASYTNELELACNETTAFLSGSEEG
ncbi:hypothetical protein BDV95DRAFT_478624 [Massariosphaeria phaeospora]|uniref:RING-type domain-containing protein n=1 Tax=Massariosphaeria phaeospora TaxID=100035 RepID=A0A7C8MLG7_9PLEO|nr:hypothetical protein BDV95DRAFT_478624 [Massariosphaeria phaeospora]